MNQNVVALLIILDAFCAYRSTVTPGAPITEYREAEVVRTSGNRLGLYWGGLPLRGFEFFPPGEEAADPAQNVLVVKLRFVRIRVQWSDASFFDRFRCQERL